MRNRAWSIAVLGWVYFFLALLGLSISPVNQFASAVWPPTGVALAALIIYGPRLWPGIFLGALAANIWAGAPLLVAIGIAAGNTAEALLGAHALRRISGFRWSMDRVADALGLILLGAALSAAVSATVGVVSLGLGGLVPRAGLAETWRTWYLGDAVSALVLTPLLLTWAARARAGREGAVSPGRRLEAVGLGLAIAVLDLVIAGEIAAPGAFQRAYVVYPCLIWAAWRFGPRGSATATLGVTVMAIILELAHRGPYAHPTLAHSLIAVQVFVGITACTFLVLAAALAERGQALAAARATSDELEHRVAQRTAESTRAEHKFRRVVEYAPEGMIIADGDGIIVLVNQRAEELFGYRRSELLGASIDMLVPERLRATHAQKRAAYTQAARARPMEINLELVGLRKQGEEFPIEVSLGPLETEQGILVSSTIRDITARKQAEASLRKAHDELELRVEERTVELARVNRELTDAVAARDSFISVASHELRTPLNALGLLAQLAARGEQPRTELLVRQVQRLTKLVDNLLDASRIAAGRLEIEPEEAELAGIVREVVARFSTELARANCQVSLDLEQAEGCWDLMRIDQVVTNLISNAMKYGAGKPIEIAVRRAGDRARLVVRDHGVGISAADQARIFQRFERVVSDRSISGLGLGLWIVQQLVQAHRGSITVDSRPGEGAAFTVELPATAAQPSLAEPEPGLAPGAEPLPLARDRASVLVVEDDPDTQEVVLESLRAAGYSVAAAANGREALDYLRRAPAPSLILLDLMMPVMNGWEFLDARDGDPALSAIPVVLLSANATVEVASRDALVTRSLRKPIDLATLLATVREHADRC